MIAVDCSPLVMPPRRGVARALAALLSGWAAEPPGAEVLLLAPEPLPSDLPAVGRVVTPRRRPRSAGAFRRALPALLRASGATILYVPWSAFPRASVPVVVTVHELPFVRLGPIEGRLRAWRHRAWLGHAVQRAAAIVVPSHAVRADVLALHPEAEPRVHVVGNGFDPATFQAAARDAVRTRRPRLVAIGTGDGAAGLAKKGIDVLFEALDRVPVADLDTVVVGAVAGARPRGVEVQQGIDDHDLARLLASAHLLVHPARSEGFGYPPLEAMAVGTPVVTSDGGALPEVVGDAALVAAAGDAAALARAIQRGLEDADLRSRLITAGRERARAFPPRLVGRRLAAVLRRAERGA